MKSFLQNKLNLDNDRIGKALEQAAKSQRANDDFIAPAAADSNVEQANGDTFLIDERMRSEAETVQKLPKTFPIEEWEKMTTKQQKKGVEVFRTDGAGAMENSKRWSSAQRVVELPDEDVRDDGWRDECRRVAGYRRSATRRPAFEANAAEIHQ
ncbi:MAG: hypothetical protein R2912_11385, partial [Eubacteriales bacterium]